MKENHSHSCDRSEEMISQDDSSTVGKESIQRGKPATAEIEKSRKPKERRNER